MDPTQFPTLISNLGFPIACCIAMFWFIQKTLTRQTEMMGDLRASMESNTETMKALINLISKE